VQQYLLSDVNTVVLWDEGTVMLCRSVYSSRPFETSGCFYIRGRAVLGLLDLQMLTVGTTEKSAHDAASHPGDLNPQQYRCEDLKCRRVHVVTRDGSKCRNTTKC
jgi:hypothetical protein